MIKKNEIILILIRRPCNVRGAEPASSVGFVIRHVAIHLDTSADDPEFFTKARACLIATVPSTVDFRFLNTLEYGTVTIAKTATDLADQTFGYDVEINFHDRKAPAMITPLTKTVSG